VSAVIESSREIEYGNFAKELSLDATSWDDEADARLAELIVAHPRGIKHR